MVTYTDYSKKGEEAVLDRASSLTGKSFQSISKLSPYPKDELNKKNKGNAGNFIEHHWFGIKNNSSPNPDFCVLEVITLPLAISFAVGI